MASSCKIAIVGGGLAGLAAAQAMNAFGMKAEVFEAAEALGEIGAAINVSTQAVKALQAIGLGDKVAAVANSSPGIYTRNMQTGEFLEFNDRHKTAARYGAPYYTVHRADLLDALFTAQSQRYSSRTRPTRRERATVSCSLSPMALKSMRRSDRRRWRAPVIRRAPMATIIQPIPVRW